MGMGACPTPVRHAAQHPPPRPAPARTRGRLLRWTRSHNSPQSETGAVKVPHVMPRHMGGGGGGGCPGGDAVQGPCATPAVPQRVPCQRSGGGGAETGGKVTGDCCPPQCPGGTAEGVGGGRGANRPPSRAFGRGTWAGHRRIPRPPHPHGARRAMSEAQLLTRHGGGGRSLCRRDALPHAAASATLGRACGGLWDRRAALLRHTDPAPCPTWAMPQGSAVLRLRADL